MLNYDILDRKAEITIPSNADGTDKVKCIDLLSQSFKNIYKCYHKPVIINEKYIGRMDLVSLALYGSDKYADILCKVNGISNPFELNEGDIILAPNIDSLNSFFVRAYKSELAPNDASLSMVEESAQKKRSDRRTANEQLVGEKNFVIDRTAKLVFY